MKALLAALILLLPGLAQAQINKCFDAAGKVVAYGAQCPPGTRSEQTSIRNAPASPSPEAKSLAEREADFRKRQVEKQEADAKAAKSSAESAQRQRACDESRLYLKNLQAGQRIRRQDPKTGESTYLADADYPKEIASAQRAVDGNCK